MGADKKPPELVGGWVVALVFDMPALRLYEWSKMIKESRRTFIAQLYFPLHSQLKQHLADQLTAESLAVPFNLANGKGQQHSCELRAAHRESQPPSRAQSDCALPLP